MNQSRLLSLEERLERIERRRRVMRIPIPRLRDRSNPLEDLDEVRFLKRFHMRKHTFIYVFDLIKTDLIRPYKRGAAIPPVLQLCIAIRFYATDAFQIVIGDLFKVDQATVSRIVVRISTLIAQYAKNVIKYPSFAESVAVRSEFYNIARFPGVSGCIDCTHAQIESPGGPNAELFRNRKGYHSLNIQAICDAKLAFTDIVIRWYGSAHDSRIFDNSLIKDRLENNEVPGILLGDGGYACTNYLMTPILNPQTQQKKRYNASQIRTRNTIERAFGVWKRRFPCLKMLRVKLANAIIVATAVAVLHNVCRKRLDLFGDDDDDKLDTGISSSIPHSPAQATISGRAARAQLIANNF